MYQTTARVWIYSLAPFSIAFFQVKSTLYFFLCHTVTLANITIQHSDGTGVVMYSTVGNNTITGSKFIANKPPNSFNGGGGLYIEFSYCYPGNTSCFEGPSNIPKDYTSGANFVISDSVFCRQPSQYITYYGLHHSFFHKSGTTFPLVGEGGCLYSSKAKPQTTM